MPSPITGGRTKRLVGTDQYLREIRFVDEYVIDFNGTKSIERAGYAKGDSAKVEAVRVLRRPRVQEMIRAKLTEMGKRCALSAEWVESRLMAEAQTATKATDRIKALIALGKRLPGFYAPEQHEVTTYRSREEHEKRIREMIEAAKSRADRPQTLQ